jgi:hypothetical protein
VCWGSNGSGELGLDPLSTPSSAIPVAVPLVSGVAQVSAGQNFTCVRLNDGTAECWGLNTSGQLGDGSTIGNWGPAPVSGLTGVLEIRAGAATTCARTTSGTYCWGLNTSGQLGDVEIESRPRHVLSLRPAEHSSLAEVAAEFRRGSPANIAVLGDRTIAQRRAVVEIFSAVAIANTIAYICELIDPIALFFGADAAEFDVAVAQICALGVRRRTSPTFRSVRIARKSSSPSAAARWRGISPSRTRCGTARRR